MPNIVVGLLALAFGLWGLSVWWWSVAEFLRGLIPILLLVVGFVALAAGITSVQRKKPEDSIDEEEDLLDAAEIKEKKPAKPAPKAAPKTKAVVKKAVKKQSSKAENAVLAAAKAEAEAEASSADDSGKTKD